MAHTTYNATTNTEALRTMWDAELGLDPTEETKIADWVATPYGAEKFGTALKLRKLPAMTVQTYTPSTTAALRANLNWNSATASTVTVNATARYSAVGLERSLLNQAIDDANYRNGYKKQLMACLDEEVDGTIFALAATLSSTVSQAAVDDAMVRTGLKNLAVNAKNKFNESAAKLLVVHTGEVANVWGIPAIKEYQIRGTIGAAVNAKMNAYGLIWRDSGKVYRPGGSGTSTYNPLLLKDAWALAWNEKPHILDVQFDGLSENFIAFVEFGAAEWFDASGVALVTTTA